MFFLNLGYSHSYSQSLSTIRIALPGHYSTLTKIPLLSNNKNQTILFGYLFSLGATIIWSGNFIVARDLNDIVPPITLAFWRWVVAVIVLFPFAIRQLITQQKIVKENILYLSITAIFGVTVFNTFIYIASHTTSALNLSLISITFPIMVIVLSRIMFKDRVSLNKILGVCCVFTGIVILISKGDIQKLINLSFTKGDIWVFIAALAFAIYSILLKFKPKELSIWALQLSTFFIGLVFLGPFYLWESLNSQSLENDLHVVSSILYLGVFASLFAYVLWFKAVENLGPIKAGMVYYTLPLFAGLSAHIFLGESVSLIHYLSACLIIPGILVANYEPAKSIN